MPRPGEGATRVVTLIPGDGVGPLVTGAVEQVFDAMHAPVEFEKVDASGSMKILPKEVLDSIRRNKVALKGGLKTSTGGGTSSLNVQLRKELDLYANLVNCFNIPGIHTRHDNVNIAIIRENTEGEYSGLEHEVIPGVVESLKVSGECLDLSMNLSCFAEGKVLLAAYEFSLGSHWYGQSAGILSYGLMVT